MTTAGVLFLFAAGTSALRIFAPDRWGGDMQGLGVLVEASVGSLGVLILSVLSYWVYRWTTGGLS